jgi:hypothetical protein
MDPVLCPSGVVLDLHTSVSSAGVGPNPTYERRIARELHGASPPEYGPNGLEVVLDLTYDFLSVLIFQCEEGVGPTCHLREESFMNPIHSLQGTTALTVFMSRYDFTYDFFLVVCWSYLPFERRIPHEPHPPSPAEYGPNGFLDLGLPD